MSRCYNVTQVGYRSHGAKHIEVCPEWHDFALFLRDMGEKPSGLTLERQDVWGDYTKSNCCWATKTAQARNKTTTRWLTFAGEKLCLTEWAERLGIKPKTLRARLDDHGWSVERALTTPVGP